VSGDAPLVSVLTPSFNQALYLPDCLASVARQTYPRIEHVVVDGGSTDGTLGVLEAAGGSVRWTSESDRGQADAVNKAFEASTGEIVGWLNSDDGLFATDTVERVVAAFAREPEAGVVFGDAALVDESGRIVRHFRSRWPSRALPLVSPLAQPAVFFSRSVLEADEPVLRVDLHRLLDYELWLRLRSRGVRFVHLPTVAAVDRDHPQRRFGPQMSSSRARARSSSRSTGPSSRRRAFVAWAASLGVRRGCRWCGVGNGTSRRSHGVSTGDCLACFGRSHSSTRCS
jgi:glycosyltransferase involved in cell wall biosynthesis